MEGWRALSHVLIVNDGGLAQLVEGPVSNRILDDSLLKGSLPT